MNFPHLETFDLDRDVIRLPARLRTAYRIRPQNSLQVGACLLHGAQVFVTNDRRLECLKNKIDILILDDFIAQD